MRNENAKIIAGKNERLNDETAKGYKLKIGNNPGDDILHRENIGN